MRFRNGPLCCGAGGCSPAPRGLGSCWWDWLCFFALGDRVLLILSGMLTFCTLLHCAEYYRTVRSRRYQVIEATCVALGRAGIGRQRKVRLLLQDGRDVTVTLDKRMDLRIGRQYRIFCRLNRAPPHDGLTSKTCLRKIRFSRWRISENTALTSP